MINFSSVNAKVLKITIDMKKTAKIQTNSVLKQEKVVDSISNSFKEFKDVLNEKKLTNPNVITPDSVKFSSVDKINLANLPEIDDAIKKYIVNTQNK